MITTQGLLSAAGNYGHPVRQKKGDSFQVKNNTALEQQRATSVEEKLSDTARNYLEYLRSTYGAYDFIVAEDGDQRKALLSRSNKEFSVIISSSELEKMAADENYAREKMHRVQVIVEMSKRLCEQFGYGKADGKGSGNGIFLNHLAISLNDDGSISIFASLKKMPENQKERIEKLREKQAEEKKEEKIKEEKAKEKAVKQKVNSYQKEEKNTVKKVVIEAASEEELIEKVLKVDWNKVCGEKVGGRFDFSI